MRPRRSRFTRIYHRITRRHTQRRQWQEISQLRPHGSLGHPASSSNVTRTRRAYAHHEPFVEQTFTPPADEFQVDSAGTFEFADDLMPQMEDTQSDGGIAVALLTIGLFLLACAYAAFSGYMHSSNDAFAWLGLTGSIGSLVAAGVGICLAASPTRRCYSGRFLAVAAVFLASLLGVLIYVAMPHP
ncbi:MAG TPA: hypothetical protein VGI81_09150 [Tepidisphaeraceae bacterium]|jgi:hypothetical protein